MNITSGCNSIAIGNDINCSHSNCILIGQNIKSDFDKQLKIGNDTVEVNRLLSDKEFTEIVKAITGAIK